MSVPHPVLITGSQAASGEVSCNICGSSALSLVSEVDRRNQPLRTVICQGCGLVFTQQSQITDIKAFYSQEYRGKGKKPALKHILRHGNNALGRYKRLKSYLTPGQRLLDIGSGSGEFVYLMASMGLKAKGIEPHERFASYCRENLGIEIEVNFLEDYALGTADVFDVVTIFHVLEHKEDPSDTMRIINQLLRPGGLCVVEVPNISSYSMTPKNLFHIDHLYNFNQATLTLLGQKCGLTVREVIFSKVQGNITVVFEKSGSPSVEPLSAPENYRFLYQKLKSHNNFNHYLTAMPYVRLLAKGLRYWRERRFVACFTDGKTMLDALYRPFIKR